MLGALNGGIGLAPLPPLTRREGITMCGFVFVCAAVLNPTMLAILDPMPKTVFLASVAVATWAYLVFRTAKE